MSMQKNQAEKIGESLTSQNDNNGLPQSLACQICSNLIKEAKITRCCGSSFCSSCIEEVFLSSENPICPSAGGCDKPLNLNELDSNDELRKLAQQWLLKKSTVTQEILATTCDNTASMHPDSNLPSISDLVESPSTSRLCDGDVFLPFVDPIGLVHAANVDVQMEHISSSFLPLSPASPLVQNNDVNRDFFPSVSSSKSPSFNSSLHSNTANASFQSSTLRFSVSLPSKPMETNGDNTAKGVKTAGSSFGINSHVSSSISPAPAGQPEKPKHPRIKYDLDNGESTSRGRIAKFAADSTSSHQCYKRSSEPQGFRRRTGDSSLSRNYRPDGRSNQQVGDYRSDKYRGRVDTSEYGRVNKRIVIDSGDEEPEIKRVDKSKREAEEKNDVAVKERKDNVDDEEDKENEENCE